MPVLQQTVPMRGRRQAEGSYARSKLRARQAEGSYARSKLRARQAEGSYARSKGSMAPEGHSVLALIRGSEDLRKACSRADPPALEKRIAASP